MTGTAPTRRRRTPTPAPTPMQQGLIATSKVIEEEAAAAEVTEESMEEAKASESPVHTIHMVEDGMTFLGKVWYRGEEFTVAEDSPQWEALADRNGNRFLFLTDEEQRRRYGKTMFRSGSWPYEGYDLEDPNLSEADRQKLAAVEARRTGKNLDMRVPNPAQPGRTARSKSDLPSFVVGKSSRESR